ncbi:DJ-1/PfpI family protein [Micrococcus luteus]|uniref:DJ-1/PfpI family protein n=1 Tax=Micrococcus luteus TaxID=1270 RepID=UPI0026D4241A
MVEGRTWTSFPSIRTDLRDTGADVVDQDVVVDGNSITSRSPDDLTVFCDTIVASFTSNSTQEEVMA